MRDRFNKRKVAEWARGRIDRLADNYGFDLLDGTAQLGPAAPKDRVLAYGEIEALQALCNAFSLMEIKL